MKAWRREKKNCLDVYLREIGEIPLIKPEEECELARKIRKGDQEALDKLVKANLRFVVRVAVGYQNQGLPLIELINEGNLGLIKAAQRFDETRGFKFISYAVWWIRQSILEAIAEHARMVRVPLNRLVEVSKISRDGAKLENKLHRGPTAEELAEASGINLANVELALTVALPHVSLFDPAEIGSQEPDASLLDVLEDGSERSPDQCEGDGELAKEIERVLLTLDVREAEIVRLHYGLGDAQRPLTLEEIAEQFNLTRERIRQIEKKALERLRFRSRNECLREYLG